jgi:putative transposase
VRESTLRIMARIDALYLEDPCSGSRRMVAYLARDEIPISRDRVRNLMRRMGLRAIYQKPRTTVPGNPSERFPCLVDLSMVTAVDQVWATDIERHEAPWERAVMKGHRHRPVAAGR